jgi:hypothetical protein
VLCCCVQPKKNDPLSYNKLVMLKRDFLRVKEILELVLRRETMKRDASLLNAEMFDEVLAQTHFAKKFLGEGLSISSSAAADTKQSDVKVKSEASREDVSRLLTSGLPRAEYGKELGDQLVPDKETVGPTLARRPPPTKKPPPRQTQIRAPKPPPKVRVKGGAPAHAPNATAQLRSSAIGMDLVPLDDGYGVGGDRARDGATDEDVESETDDPDYYADIVEYLQRTLRERGHAMTEQQRARMQAELESYRRELNRT